jgi:hypothetical protein
MRRFPIILTAGLVLAVLTAGCGSDSDGGGGDNADATTSTPVATGASKPSGTSAIGFTCPRASVVSTTVGHDVAVKGSQSNKYCEYSFKDQAANSISVIYTWSSFDVTQDPGVSNPETVSGLGQRAIWEAGANDLSVWTGKGSVVLNFLPLGFPDFNQKAVAIKLAKLVL